MSPGKTGQLPCRARHNRPTTYQVFVIGSSDCDLHSQDTPLQIIGKPADCDSMIESDLHHVVEFNTKNNNSSCNALVEQAMEISEKHSRRTRGRLWPQILASLVLAIAAMIEGYSSGYTSPALSSMTRVNSTISVNDQQVGIY